MLLGNEGSFRKNLLVLYVVYHHVRFQVEYFHLLFLYRVEELLDVVYRGGDEIARRMPIRIRHVADSLLGFGIKFADFFVLDNVSSAVGSTHVEHHLVRVVHAERMAVDAVISRHVVLDDGFFLETFQVSLVDTDDVPLLLRVQTFPSATDRFRWTSCDSTPSIHICRRCE